MKVIDLRALQGELWTWHDRLCCGVLFGYGCLLWVVRVQSVTWAAIDGYPCGRWVGVVLFTLCSQCQGLGHPHL